MGLTYKEDATDTRGTPASLLLRVADPKHEKPLGFDACGTGCSITWKTTTAGDWSPNSNNGMQGYRVPLHQWYFFSKERTSRINSYTGMVYITENDYFVNLS